MYAIAAGTSALVLGATASDHSGLAIAVDLALGAVSFVALWFRRSHPVAVGVITGVCSLASATAGGPALLALFNVAIRASRRAIAGMCALALASTAIFPLLYAGDEPYALQIMLGLLNFESARGAMPAHAVYSDDGKPLLSWRVQILPYLEHQDLYNQFHLDEPWDSEHNKQLVEQMPEVFRDPASKLTTADGKSNYLGVTGESAVYRQGEKGTGQDFAESVHVHFSLFGPGA